MASFFCFVGDDMPISDQLLSKLVCPECRGKLKYDQEASHLDCDKCKLRFSVVDNIPVLLLDEARELK